MNKITLYLNNEPFGNAFSTKKEAADFMYRYIANHPDENLTPFDFKITKEHVDPTLVRVYQNARIMMPDVKSKEMKVSDFNKDKLSKLNELLTIAAVWNKLDGFTPNVRDTEQAYAVPVFEFHPEYGLCNETANSPFNGFSLNQILSFKTTERANQFAEIFKDHFKIIFGL